MTTYYTEPQRKIPVYKSVDVVVAGGGVSGFCAAIAAARAGAKTLLIERAGWVGGYLDSGWGAGTVGYVFNDSDGNIIMKGICWELLERLAKLGAAMPPMKRRFLVNTWPYETENRVFRPQILQEAGKAVVLEMLEEAGADLLLHTLVADVIREGKRVTGLVIENKSGRQAVTANVVVDCTGDADVAARAGAAFDTVPADTVYQVSRGFVLANVDTAAIRRRIADNAKEFAYVMEPVDVPEGFQKPISGIRWKIEDLEVSDQGRHLKGGPGSHSSEAVGILRGIAHIGANVDGVDATDAAQVTRAEVEIRKKVFARWRKMRAERPEFKESILLPGSLDLGVRETRRIKGEYTLTTADIAEGRRFDDAIAQTMIALDCHHPKGNWEEWAPRSPYDIPYRIMLPKETDGLLVAGRCVSVEHLALAAIRKIPICMALGQAAGVAAAVASRAKVQPRAADMRAIQKELAAQGVPLRKN